MQRGRKGARGEIEKRKGGSVEKRKKNSTSSSIPNKKRRPLPLPAAAPRLPSSPRRPPGPASPGAPAAAAPGPRRRPRIHARAGDGLGPFFSLLFFSGFFPSSLLFIKEKHLTISFSFLSPRETRTTNTRAWDRAWPTAQSTPSSARGTPLPWRPRRQRRKWPPPRTSPAALGPSRSWPA